MYVNRTISVKHLWDEICGCFQTFFRNDWIDHVPGGFNLNIMWIKELYPLYPELYPENYKEEFGTDLNHKLPLEGSVCNSPMLSFRVIKYSVD